MRGRGVREARLRSSRKRRRKIPCLRPLVCGKQVCL